VTQNGNLGEPNLTKAVLTRTPDRSGRGPPRDRLRPWTGRLSRPAYADCAEHAGLWPLIVLPVVFSVVDSSQVAQHRKWRAAGGADGDAAGGEEGRGGEAGDGGQVGPGDGQVGGWRIEYPGEEFDQHMGQ
jgi:hypothetical protein